MDERGPQSAVNGDRNNASYKTFDSGGNISQNGLNDGDYLTLILYDIFELTAETHDKESL